MTDLLVAPATADVADAGDPRVGSGRVGLAVVSVVAALSAAALFFGVFALGLSHLQEQRSQDQGYSTLRGLFDPSSPVAPPIGGAIAQGAPIAIINAARADLHDVVVFEGTTSGDLLAGPGHLADSPLPGQVGESILMGKSVTAGAPFHDVDQLAKGDVITVTTGQGTFTYVVEGRRHAGSALPTIPKSGSLLTLVTSSGSGVFGALTPSQLVYVDAALDGAVAPTPPGRPTTVASDEVQGSSDPSAWPYVALWLLAYAAACLAIARLWSRWGLARTWLIGAPVLLGILWAFSTEAMRLLPNVY